jgi:hypothetical protein
MEIISIQKLLLLRKATRALSEQLRGMLKEHIGALAPLIRPKPLLGDFVSGSTKESPNFADKSFQEIVAAYQAIGAGKPFTIPKDLKPPLEVSITPLELHPHEYTHTAKSGADTKAVTVYSPMKWVLSYPGYSPESLRVLLAQKNPSGEVLQKYAVHYAVLNWVISKQPLFARTLEALRFPVTSGKIAEFGALPVTFLSAPVATMLPPDEVIVESTEIAGSDVFEEVLDMATFESLRDPLREQILTTLQPFGIEASGSSSTA